MLAGLLYGIAEALITALLGSAYTQIVMFTAGHRGAGADAERPVRPRGGEEGMRRSARAIAVAGHRGPHARGVSSRVCGDGYYVFVLALVALTAIVGVGLNMLLGLTGQVSFGHVGFYAIGAYTVGHPHAARQ